MEDCEWMARWGETLTGAAHRLGYRSRDVLDRVLQRAHRPDLIAQLKAREKQTGIDAIQRAHHVRT